MIPKAEIDGEGSIKDNFFDTDKNCKLFFYTEKSTKNSFVYKYRINDGARVLHYYIYFENEFYLYVNTDAMKSKFGDIPCHEERYMRGFKHFIVE